MDDESEDNQANQKDSSAKTKYDESIVQIHYRTLLKRHLKKYKQLIKI